MKPYPEPCSTGSISVDNGEVMLEREEGGLDRDKPPRPEIVAMIERSLIEHAEIWRSMAGGDVE